MADDNSGVVGEALGVVGDIAKGVGDELKNLGKSVVGQVTSQSDDKGVGEDSFSDKLPKDLEDKKAVDDEQSQNEYEEVRAKVDAIYSEYAKKKEQEKTLEKKQEEKAEEQKAELVKEQKKQSMDVSIAQAKASAENKNMGAE